MRYHVTFLTMGPFVATLLGRALIKKVGENDGRVAKNEMLESFGSDSGNHFPGKVSVFDGRVAKNNVPILARLARLAPTNWRRKCGPEPPFHTRRGSG